MKANSERENPKARKNKAYFRIFGTAFIILSAVFINGCKNDVMKDQTVADPVLSASIAETFPANQADTVVINPVVAVTFKSTATTSEVLASTLILKEGTIPVSGTVTTSGTTVSFTPSSDLKPNTTYTATLTNSLKSGSSKDSGEHSWSFKTGKHRNNNSISVVSVTPIANATEVSVDARPTVAFNQEMTSTMVKLVTISFWQGTTSVSGTLTYSGKTATFTPTNKLMGGTVYNGKVVFGSKSHDDGEDDDDNKSASAFKWNFTTSGGGADVTPPTVLSSVPANNATAVAINSKATVTLSEAMSAATINATNFSLKQGSTTIVGTVTLSGNTATFTPSASLAANMVYTLTVSTAVKDATGNALASNYTSSFTTVAATPVVSFASQVLPILQSRCIPCHGATSPTAGISITNYTTVSQLSNSQLDNSGMYPKLGTTAAEQQIIKAWIAAGRLNN